MLFSTKPQCCWTFSWIELQMLFRCCLIHITIIILRQNLYLIYLCLYLCLGLYMSHVCNLFFIFSLTFIVINHITSLKQTHLFFIHFVECLLLFLGNNLDKESEQFSNIKSSASGCCLAFAWFFANLSQSLLIKKTCKLIQLAYQEIELVFIFTGLITFFVNLKNIFWKLVLQIPYSTLFIPW